MMERKTATAFERGAHSPHAAPLASKDALATVPKPLNGSVVSARQLTALTDEDVELTPTTSSNRIKEPPMPPLDLRQLERQDSSATSSTSVDDSEGSSESDEEEVVSYDVNSQEEFLIKPMPTLPVCPMDDLAVEEEKRRRRSVRMMKKDMHCPDAECLPSPTSQYVPAPRRFTTSQIASGGDVARAPLSAPLLRRDSMAIRQQYWKQLGLNMSRRDLERNTGRRRERHVGVKVQLNDTRSKKGESKSIFQIIASWYASNDKLEDKESSIGAASDTDSTASTTDSSASPRQKSIRFCEEAELFYIPLHKDYSKRQRDCMWHTRTEFISMVERNLEQVYDEMEREYEEQLQAEMAENDAMAQEEARQRAYEAQMQARAVSRAKASPTQRSTPTTSPVSSPPLLALCPIATQIKVTPRARSPHDIRFKYLKHLGINN